ncbi:MAG: proteasome subunit beta [Thermofilaceae archaeon]|nr:proteasome subunit beta [Thermofilaceae archaeon]MCX8180198.1 proteasome subunit beta [Thermofilaceae archaeon]
MYTVSPFDINMKPLKGTTTVGIAFEDFVVLAADRRATSGYYIAHKKAEKIHKIDDHAAATIAGYVGDAQWLVDQLRAEALIYRNSTGEPISIPSLATLASTILFRSRPFIIVQMLIGGVDNSGSKLFSLDWLGTVTEERYTATGSGTPYAISLIESEYRVDMRPEDALKLAAKAVKAATLRDPGSGEGVDLALITGKNGVEIMRGEEIL